MPCKKERTVFLENPYDIETLFETLSIAYEQEKELLYMDKLIATIRLDPEGDLTKINYNILKDLKLINTQDIQ